MDAAKSLEHEQIIVAGHDEIGAAGDRCRENDIVVGIAANALWQRHRFDDFTEIGKIGDRGDYGRAQEPFTAQDANELVTQWRGPDNFAKIDSLFDQLAAKASDRKCGEENVRIEQDSHETILKTSSSV